MCCGIFSKIKNQLDFAVSNTRPLTLELQNKAKGKAFSFCMHKRLEPSLHQVNFSAEAGAYTAVIRQEGQGISVPVFLR